MASAVQKIKLSPSRDIPFNKLVLSQSNVRRVKAGVSIEQLAESIALRTLLQSLSVRAVVDADGQETGMFEVPAGGRRYRALELLVKQKRMAKTQLVPCVVRDDGFAEDDSLAENDERIRLRASPIGWRRDMSRNAAELANRLAREAEAVCRHYLSNGRRVGNYWQVGDVRNTSGRSMFVRLKGVDAGGRRVGKWTDAATGEHGDLLDVIRESCGLVDFHDVTEEARRFLSLPRSKSEPDYRPHLSPVPTGSPQSARRLFAMSKPIAGTVVETYLRGRGITDLHDLPSLRFHPHCYYRPDADAPTEIWPAMIAAVTDLRGHITGAHRTWLDRSGRDKAPVDTPRRAMGHLLGHAVRFGPAGDVMAVGEGIETMLSLRCVMPSMAMGAALSAAHLGAILFPATLRRLYIVRDNDPAGDCAVAGLLDRAQSAGIEAMVLSPQCGDFNEDLRNSDINALRAALRLQLAPEDVVRFLSTSVWTGAGDEAGTPP